MSDQPTSTLDLHAAAFVFEPGVGLTIATAEGSVWLSWDETKELTAWLAERVERAP